MGFKKIIYVYNFFFVTNFIIVLFCLFQVMEGSGKVLVVAVGKYSQAGIIKNLASGSENIKSWVTLDGSVNVTSGSANVVYNPLNVVLTKVVAVGSQIKIAGVEYTITNSIENKKFTIDRPYDGVTNNMVEVSYLPKHSDEEEVSVLQGKLVLLAGMIGRIGTFVAVVTVLVMIIEYLVQLYGYGEFGGVFNWEYLLKICITGVTILVVSIPEGLPLAVTLSLAFSVQKMLADNNLVKHLDACETMGSATTICSDKTGTLTTNRMTVMKGYLGRKHFDRKCDSLFSKEAIQILADCIALNSGKTTVVKDSTALGGLREYLGNKTECALLNMLMDMKIDYEAIRNDPVYNYPSGVKLFPFNSAKKRMSIVVKTKSGGLRLYTKGASETVLELCDHILLPDGSVAPISHSEKDQTNKEVIEKFADDGYRTLSLAYKDLTDCENVDWANVDQDAFETGLTMIAVVGIEDPLREEVPKAIETCERAGITVRMVTGDNVRTATTIAKRCRIIPEKNPERFIVMEGPEFRRRVLDANGNLLQGEFDKIWPRLRVLARSSPKDKYTLITGLLNSELHKAKARGELDGSVDYPFVGDDRQVVAVTGDGTNDAPALSKADVGFAMGITGTEVAKDACDIVLLDDNFESIVKSVKWGRNVYDSIGKFLQFQLTVNVVAITLAVVGALSQGESPIASVQLLWVNLIMDSLGSLALATEIPNDSLLLRKPYSRNASIISPRMIKNIGMAALYQLIVVFFLLYGQTALPSMFIKYGDVDHPSGGKMFQQCEAYSTVVEAGSKSGSPYDECVTTLRNTIIFNAFVMMQLANEINSRKLHDELNVFAGIFGHYLFATIILITLGIQILIVQFTGVFFHVHSGGLTLEQWGVCVAFGLGMFPWGLVMHLIPPCWEKKQATYAADDTIIAGTSDDIVRQLSLQKDATLGTSKRIENATASYHIPTQTSTTILSQARRGSGIKNGFVLPEDNSSSATVKTALRS